MRSLGVFARALRATYLFWLMFVLTQPVAVHACPLRNDPRAETSRRSESAQRESAQRESAQRESAQRESAQRMLADGGALCEGDSLYASNAEHVQLAQSSHHADHGQHSGMAKCDCVGDCCASMAAIPPRAPTTIPVPERIARQAEQYPKNDRLFYEADYRLPPSTAPPIHAESLA